MIYFRSYWLQKAWLIKSLKSTMSENLWTVNKLKGPKNCSSLQGISFVIFFLSLWDNSSSKNTVLVVSEILRLFVNVLTPDDK